MNASYVGMVIEQCDAFPIETKIDKSNPRVINRANDVRQVCYMQPDGTGYAAVEILNKRRGEWREITGHSISEIEVEKFLEAVVCEPAAII